jgi:hypothetical protein
MDEWQGWLSVAGYVIAAILGWFGSSGHRAIRSRRNGRP